MKNMNRIFAFLLIFTFVTAQLFAGTDEKSSRGAMGKASTISTGKFDGNRIDDDLENNGMIVSQRPSGHSGMAWPAGNNTYTVYASGVWLAGKVAGDIRTAVAEYGPEFTSGPWLADGSGAEDVLYKVNKTDLLDPAANPDFANWPTDQGAPWVDENANGIYEPMVAAGDGGDHPEFIGDQVIFYVMNDGVATDHSIFNTAPLGLEIRMTIWGYDRGDAFGDMMFAKAQIYNMGGNDITDTYLGLWSDPDLGNASDDFVGCDLDLSLGFCYNDGADNAFGYEAPAVGYDFFQAAFPTGDPTDQQFCFGEVKSGYKSLPMSSFVKYINSDDVYTDPADNVEAYNYMSGFLRDGSPFINSATGEATKFVHPDDPNLNIDGTDNIWVDGDDNPADDRRFLMNVGPFDFDAGDSAEVVFGILHAQGNSALGSVSLLKFNDKFAQSAYDANFDLPAAPPIPTLTASRANGEIILEWEDNAEDYSVYIAGNNSYYEFEGYNVYQHEAKTGQGTRELVATYDLKNGLTTIKDDVFSLEYSDVLLLPVQFGTDTGIKRYISITTDALIGNLPLVDDRNYYYSVTAYGYNGFATPRTLESSSPIIAIRPQTDVAEALAAGTGEAAFDVTHNGTADASVDVMIANPYDLTGDTYTVFFDQQHYYRNLAGLWMKTAYADSVGKLAKAADLTGTVVDGAAIASATVGSIDLVYSMTYVSPDGAWIDGIEIDLPDNVTVNSFGSIEGHYSSYGTASGQNVPNGDGTMAAGNVITWGDSARSTFGGIEGDITVLINVAPITFPFVASYKVFDDGYGTVLDVGGSVTITELGFDYRTIKHWNLKNSAGTVLLEDMTTLDGIQSDYVDANNVGRTGAGNIGTTSLPVVDGFQVNVAANYAAPVQENSITHVGDGTYDWDSYNHYGWAATSRASDAWGYGTSSVDNLQMDYELRWTGEYGDILDINGDGSVMYHTIKAGTGSIATWVGTRGYTAADHPDNTAGTPYFQMRIPFEVWNKDTDEQVSAIIYDRIASPLTDADFYAFNPFDRVYFFLWNEAYDETVTYDDADGLDNGQNNGDNLTWNIISWQAEWETGDVTTIAYDNPIQLGSDEFVFTPPAPTAKALDLDMIKVWPNPYFAYNPEERTPLQNRIHFINLPETATISIYTLAGQLVRTLEHEGGQEEIWNAQNSFKVLVASGVYIAVVDTGDETKVLKLAVVMPQQRLDVY